MEAITQWLDAYYKGEDVKFNNLQTMEYAQKWELVTQRISQQPDNTVSLNLLANMYKNGQGVTQNYPKTIRLYNMAINKGDGTAMNNLAYMYEHGEGIPQNYLEAIRLFNMAIDKGHTSSMYNLAYMYQYGEGVPQNYLETIRLYQMAIDKGHTSSMYNLAYMYQKGQGVPQNYPEAIRLLNMAIDKGNPDAMYNLANMYEHGEGVPQNYQEAIRLFNMAIDKGNRGAMYSLACMYQYGEGVVQNRDEDSRLCKMVIDKSKHSTIKSSDDMTKKDQVIEQSHIELPENGELDKELASIKQINDINDLIRLGKLYHSKKRTTYMGVDMKKLHDLQVPLEKLNRMIGLTKIKENIVNQIVYFLSGLQSDNNDMMHTIIEGPPGSGKTEVGHILGEIYTSMGLLEKKVFKIVKRSELIGKYLGHTSNKTQEVIDSCRGGVMFIDEAYSLGDNNGRDSFSKECLDTLNQNLSDNKGKFLCIIAGYTDALEKNFFSFNEGLRRRFTFKYVIDKYTHDELRDIFLMKVKEMGWTVSDDVKDVLSGEFFKENYALFPHYGGDMETLFLNIRIYHGRRIFCLDKTENRKILNSVDFEEGLKVFKGHRQQDAKMKEYSMYL